MRTEQEIREQLAQSQAWLDEYEGGGAAEEGIETGWEQALSWVLKVNP